MRKSILLLCTIVLMACPTGLPDPDPDPSSDSAAVAGALSALTFELIKGANTGQDTVTTNLVLPATGESGTSITWASDTPAVVTTDGTVTRPVDSDATVTLTATVAKNLASDTKDFVLTVLLVLSDAESVVQAKAALTFDVIRGENTAQDQIRFDLALPPNGDHGTTVAWVSSDAAVASDGAITRSTASDTPVTLTGTISKGLQSDDVIFALTVKQAVAVTWGSIQFPASTTTTAGVPTESIFGWVYAAGVTDQAVAGVGITAQVGYGATGSDPSVGGWIWTDAALNPAWDFAGQNNDEYMATLTIATAGTYAYAYRYSGDDGGTWIYGDTSGTPYNPLSEGVVTVNP